MLVAVRLDGLIWSFKNPSKRFQITKQDFVTLFSINVSEWLCLRFVWWFVFIKFIEWMLYDKMYFEVRCSKMIEMFLIVIVVPPYNWFCSLGYRLKTLLSISEKLGKLCLCSLNLQLRNVRVLPWLPLQDPLKLFLRMLLLELRVKGRWKCIIHQNKCNR